MDGRQTHKGQDADILIRVVVVFSNKGEIAVYHLGIFQCFPVRHPLIVYGVVHEKRKCHQVVECLLE